MQVLNEIKSILHLEDKIMMIIKRLLEMKMAIESGIKMERLSKVLIQKKVITLRPEMKLLVSMKIDFETFWKVIRANGFKSNL